MTVIAHAGHWALGLLELAPIIVVLAFAIWKSRGERVRDRFDAIAARTP